MSGVQTGTTLLLNGANLEKLTGFSLANHSMVLGLKKADSEFALLQISKLKSRELDFFS